MQSLTIAERADAWLYRLSKLAQIATPILALLGFWYTVVPLYSKAVLEERVAQTQLELISQQNDLSTLESTISAKQLEVEELMHQISVEEERSSSLQDEIGELAKQRRAAEKSAAKATQDSKRLYEEMRASIITAAFNDAVLCLVSVSDWSGFYMVFRRQTQDEEPKVMGERYKALDEIAPCIASRIMSAFGVSRLSSNDKVRLSAILAKHRAELIADLQKIDDMLSDERDAFLSAEIFLAEHEERQEKQTQRLSNKKRLEQMKTKIQAAVDFQLEHMERIKSLSSDGMAKLSAYSDRVRSDLIMLQWME